MTADAWVERDATAFSEALARGRCTPYEKEYLHSDGTVVPVLISFGFTKSAKGLAAAFVIDLTEQRRHEAAQHEIEDQLRFSLEAGHLGAWDLDLATWTLRCSEIGQQLYGRVLSRDVTLTEFVQMAHLDDQDDVSRTIAHAVATGGGFSYRVPCGLARCDHPLAGGARPDGPQSGQAREAGRRVGRHFGTQARRGGLAGQ